jgi:hypothetical protein
MMLSVCSLHGFSFGGVYLVLIFFWTQGYMIVIAQRNSTVLVAPNNIRPYVWPLGPNNNNNKKNSTNILRRIHKNTFFSKGKYIFTEYSEKSSRSFANGHYVRLMPEPSYPAAPLVVVQGGLFSSRKKGSGSGSRSTISLRPRTYGAAPSSLRWPGAQGGVVVEAKSKDRSSTPCG